MKCPKCGCPKFRVTRLCIVKRDVCEYEDGEVEEWFEEDSDPADRVDEPLDLPIAVYCCFNCGTTIRTVGKAFTLDEEGNLSTSVSWDLPKLQARIVGRVIDTTFGQHSNLNNKLNYREGNNLTGYYDCQLRKFFGEVDDQMKKVILDFYRGVRDTYKAMKETTVWSCGPYDLIRAKKTSEGYLLDLYNISSSNEV